MSKLTIPFGKYRGKPLDQVPDSYLLWCLENVTFRNDGLKEGLEAELKSREESQPPKTEEAPTEEKALEQLQTSWYQLMINEFCYEGRDPLAKQMATKVIDRGREVLQIVLKELLKP